MQTKKQNFFQACLLPTYTLVREIYAARHCKPVPYTIQARRYTGHHVPRRLRSNGPRPYHATGDHHTIHGTNEPSRSTCEGNLRSRELYDILGRCTIHTAESLQRGIDATYETRMEQNEYPGWRMVRGHRHMGASTKGITERGSVRYSIA